MTKRNEVINLIESKGPGDCKSISQSLGWHAEHTRQLLRRMVADGELATLPLAPRTFITTRNPKQFSQKACAILENQV